MEGCFGGFSFFLAFSFKDRSKVWVWHCYYSQPTSWPEPCVPTRGWHSICLLSCNVTLVPRLIDPLQVLPFSSQNLCLKGQKKRFTFKCVMLSNAHHFQQCWSFDWALRLRSSWGPALSCVFLFLFVWSLPGSCGHIERLSCSWHTSSGLADLPSQIHSGHLSCCPGKPCFWCWKVIPNVVSVLFCMDSEVGNLSEPSAQNRRCLCTKMAVVGLKPFKCPFSEGVPIAKTIRCLPWQESVCSIDSIQVCWYLGFFICQTSSAQFSYGTPIVWIAFTFLRLLL